MLPFSPAWWSGPFFHPAPGVLSFSESLVGLAPLTSPLQWLGASPIAAYNVAFVLSFVLSAYAAFLLAGSLGLSRGVAFVAGLAYGFAPYRAGHLAHLQILSAYWIPLLFLGAHRFLESGRLRWLVVFAGAWGLQGLTNGYYLVFVSVLLACWLAWFVPSRRHWRRGGGLLLACALAACALAPVLHSYGVWHARYGFRRTTLEIQALSADLLGLVSAAPALAHWPAPSLPLGESWLFPGLTVPILLGLLVFRWRAGRRLEHGRLATLAALVAALAAATAAVTAMVGPWRLAAGPLTLSVKALGKPLAVAFYGLLLALASSRRVQAAWRRASVPAFYLLGGLAMLVLALGPLGRYDGTPVWEKAPYFYLLRLPGLDALRSPARFAMLAVFCFALAAAFSLERLTLGRGRWRSGLVVLAAAGAVWDGWLVPLPVHPAPTPLRLVNRAGAASVLELPLGPERDPAAMVRGISHGLPVWNGYSGYVPPHYHALTLGIERREPGVFSALREQGPLVVLLDLRAADAGDLERFILGEPGVVPLGDEEDRRGFLLSGLAAAAVPALGQRVFARLSHGDDQRAVYELAEPQRVAAVAILVDPWRLPRQLTLEVREGPREWQTAWQGPLAGLAIRNGLRDPLQPSVVLATPGAHGQLLRLRFTDGGIDRVAVFAPPD